MRRAALFLLLISPISLTACGSEDGGRSGVPPDTLLTALTPDQEQILCAWAVEASGGTVCEDGTEETVTVAECAGKFQGYNADCTATVADYERCLWIVKDCGFDQGEAEAACGILILCTSSD